MMGDTKMNSTVSALREGAMGFSIPPYTEDPGNLHGGVTPGFLAHD